MKVKDVLTEMEDHSFDGVLVSAIVNAYKADFACDSIEEDYRIANTALKEVLSVAQKGDLVYFEAACNENRTYAANYGFKAGMYCGFMQHFTEDEEHDGGFDKTVCKDLFQEPMMKRHRDSYDRSLHCNELEDRLANELDEVMRGHLVAVRCAWENRIHNAALQGFYCGYRAAWSIIEAVKPFSTMNGISKVLTMEYFLGYIKSNSELG